LPKIGRIGYSLAHADSLASHFADSVENSSAAHMTMVQIAAKGQSVTLAGAPVLFSRDFLINATEVTQDAYQKVVGVNPSSHVGGSLPVENVSWYDAVRYCNQLSADSGFDQCYDTTAWSCDLSKNGFRLPTEAEWLFAYEAGYPGKYYWGDTMDGRYVWYGLNSNGQTHGVGAKLPNNFGLYDMAGNVWEWCYDWGYGAPTQDTVDWTGPLTGSSRTLRGGQYGNYNNGTQDGTLFFSSTFSYAEPPTNKEPYTGFRCVRSVLK
jgi:formylglycine-generating enzyme required for sulfatase activity